MGRLSKLSLRYVSQFAIRSALHCIAVLLSPCYSRYYTARRQVVGASLGLKTLGCAWGGERGFQPLGEFLQRIDHLQIIKFLNHQINPTLARGGALRNGATLGSSPKGQAGLRAMEHSAAAPSGSSCP